MEIHAPPPLLEARGLRRTFDGGRMHALRGMNFSIGEGEFVAIQGPSGCGKTTLLQILGGLDLPTDGELLFRGAAMPRRRDLPRFRARMVGFVFQAARLLPTLTALENVQIPMLELPWSAAERRRRALALLESVGLSDRLNHRPAMLSGGERQRVAVARSLANDPQLVLADEPTGNLDSASAERVLALLKGLRAARRMTLLLVTHDASVAGGAERVVHMIDGRLVDEPPVNPRVA